MKKETLIKTMRGNAILRFIMPRVLRYLNPNYSYCSKCGLPWNWCRSKSVKYNDCSFTFATCDYCWENSTLGELKQYYTETYRMQQRGIIGTEYTMGHTLAHLLKCVEAEYDSTRKVRIIDEIVNINWS